MDLQKYEDVTQAEVDSFVATLNREIYKPLGITIEKWDGNSFSNLLIDAIKEKWGNEFYLVKQYEKLLYVTFENTLDSYFESCVTSEIEKEIEKHFSDRKKIPADKKDIVTFMRAISDLELQNLEIQQGQQLLAQQLTDLELTQSSKEGII